MDPYLGQLVVLRLMWTFKSNLVGVVVDTFDEDKLIVMWSTDDGIELKTHIKDAVLPVTSYTQDKIKGRACVFK
jgi:hypothetical protein